MNICKIKNCTNKVLAKYYCSKHYQQISKHGKILKRTRFDKNKILTRGDICYMDLYNTLMVKIGTTKFNKRHLTAIRKFKWHYSVRKYVETTHKKKKIELHRFIMNTIKTKLIVDHIDRKPLNNLDNNLRIVTAQQNCINSTIKGYYFDKSRNRWYVRLTTSGKTKHFGYFVNKLDAKKKAKIEIDKRYNKFFK